VLGIIGKDTQIWVSFDRPPLSQGTRFELHLKAQHRKSLRLNMKESYPKRKLEAVIDELITKKETAKRLKLCTRKIELMVKAKEIPVIRIGSAVRFNWVAVLASLEATY
jgi:excisionase family DNA binding protein